MDWLTILYQIFEVCLVPLLGILTTYFVKYINTKCDTIAKEKDNDLLSKYLYMLDDTITSCVIATNQTYVNTLKEEHSFDADAQKQAFQKTYNAVMKILSADVVTYLQNVMGDLTDYITQKIEAEVLIHK